MLHSDGTWNRGMLPLLNFNLWLSAHLSAEQSIKLMEYVEDLRPDSMIEHFKKSGIEYSVNFEFTGDYESEEEKESSEET